MIVASQNGWSILGTVARFRAPPRGMLSGTLGNPRTVETSLTETQARPIAERLKPILADLNDQRRVLFNATESQLRLKMTAAAAAGLILGWLFMGDMLIGLALMAGGAFFAFLMLAPKADDAARAQTKHAIIDVMAGELLCLTSVAPDARPPVFSTAAVDSWRLLPPVREITVDDLLVGERGGHHVSLSRVGLQFGGSANVQLKQGDGTVFVISEIADADIAHGPYDAITIVVGTDAPAMLRGAPQLGHGLAKTGTGDQAFDARYTVYGDPNPLTPEVRAGFADLEAVARCDRTGTRDVSAGSGLRPAVIIGPGRLVALTPIPVFDGALEPPPFWEPLAAENLIPAFASDLAVLDDYLTAALKLHTILRRTDETTRGLSA